MRRPAQPHLEYRASGFYWRRRWPAAVLRHFATPSVPGAKTISPSFSSLVLRTHLPGDARILAQRLTALSDRICGLCVECPMPIALETVQTLLTSLARFEIETHERQRALAPPRSREAVELARRREAAIQATLEEALALGNREVARAPLRHVAAHLGIELDECDDDWRSLSFEATRVLLDVSRERQRRERGEYRDASPHVRTAITGAAPTAAVAMPCLEGAFASIAPIVARVPVQPDVTFQVDALVSVAPRRTS